MSKAKAKDEKTIWSLVHFYNSDHSGNDEKDDTYVVCCVEKTWDEEEQELTTG